MVAYNKAAQQSIFDPWALTNNANLFANYAQSLNPASGTGNVGSYYSGSAGGIGGVYGGGSTSGTATGGGSVPFSLNPTPTQGSGTTFGMVPGAIGAPPSIWQQEQEIPGMSAATTAETGLINSQLAGQLSASTTEGLEDTAAARGLSLGQGGNTGLVNEILLKTLGLTKEQLQQEGAQNYNQFLSTSGQQQESPQLMADIASRNAAMAAAPNPTLAAEEAISLGSGSGGGVYNGMGRSYNPYTSSSGNGGYGQLIQQLLNSMNNPATGSSTTGTSGMNMNSGSDMIQQLLNELGSSSSMSNTPITLSGDDYPIPSSNPYELGNDYPIYSPDNYTLGQYI